MTQTPLPSCSRTFRVAVEGNIGCGKSTFLSYFKELSPKIQVSPETIELWTDVNGFKLFVRLSKIIFRLNYRRHIMLIQTDGVRLFKVKLWLQHLKDRLKYRLLLCNYLSALSTVVVIALLKCCLGSKCYQIIQTSFFTPINRISEEDVKVYDKFYEWGMSMPIFQLDLIVYLRCSPEICAERIRKRDRRGESAISTVSLLV
uniref:Deoxynucleoside kinase domain-containing protein n=1 Tax=Echinococcus canadensis TaxID=519352 RepID=A0A915EUV6_9CEST